VLPQPDPTKRPPYRRSGSSYLRDPLQMGITIVGITAAFGGAGWWLDSLLGTFPILMCLGAILGLFGIIYLTYIQLRDSDENSPPPQDKDRPRGDV
jgi:hypothetical protein